MPATTTKKDTNKKIRSRFLRPRGLSGGAAVPVAASGSGGGGGPGAVSNGAVTGGGAPGAPGPAGAGGESRGEAKVAASVPATAAVLTAAAVPTAAAWAALSAFFALRLARPRAGGAGEAGGGAVTPGCPSHWASPVTGSTGGFQITGPTAVGLPGASGGGGGNVVWARGTGAVGGSKGGSSPGEAATDEAVMAASGAAPLRHRLRFLTGGATTASPGGPAGALVHAALSAG